MGELTSELPKPMLKIQGKPILQYILEGLKETGITRFCVITGFKAEAIESYFRDGSDLGVEIIYRRQMTQDGTGKAPELARDFVGQDDFLLTYGDILVKPETYHQLVDRFNGGDFEGALTATAGEEVTKGGFLIFDREFRLEMLVEKPKPEDLDRLRREGKYKEGDPVWYNAGIYIFRPSLFDYTAKLEKSPRGEYELTDAISAMLVDGRPLAGLEIKGRWVDVRDPQVLERLEKGE